MSARDLLAASTPRPWTVAEYADGDTRYEDVRTQDESSIIVLGEGCFLPDEEAANLRLIVAAVNEYEALLGIREAAAAFVDGFTGHYSCGCCPGVASFLVQDEQCDCGCHVAARQAIALRDALARDDTTRTT